MKRPLSSWQKAVLSLLCLCLAVPALATSLQLVTTVDPVVGPPASGGGNSMNPIITPDGRYVLFASTADNLALTSNNTPFPAQSPPKINVFLRDRTNGTTVLVSINLAGTGGGNGDSMPIELSTNGQFALFESSASDLVPSDTNNVTDVFVRDLVNGTNILVSIGADGGCANGASGESAMTPDGRFVAFASTASNLVPGDTNGIQDIFVRDLVTGVTTLASPGAMGPGRSDSPQLIPDGRYVAFLSTATNLVPGVATTGEVYVRDLTGAVTYLASGNAHSLIAGNVISYNQTISDNGQFVAFESSTNGSSAGGVIQRYDLQSGFTDTVYSNAVAAPIGYPLCHNLDITPDGRFIAFVIYSNYTYVLSSRYTNSFVYLWDSQTATATLVSCDTNNLVPVNSVCDWPVVDSSGRFVVFLSTATSLTTNAVAGDYHLYLRDVLAGTTTLLDADTNGFGFPKDFMNPARLTPDGRFLAFDCSDEFPATNIYNQFIFNQFPAYADRSLVPNDNNQACDVFVRDLTTNTIELVSVRQPALPSQSPGDSSPAMIISVDTGGRYVAFASASTSLVPNDTNTFRGVFVHDLLSGTNLLVSVDTNGLANANAMSMDPSISGDGRYVTFTSFATNLVAGYSEPWDRYGLGSSDVFVRDLQTGITRLVSVSADGTSSGGSNSCASLISADGRYVLFHSWANNLTTNSYWPPPENLSLRDLQVGTTYTLGYGYIFSSRPVLGPSMGSAMTPDGRFIAFFGHAASLSGDAPCLFVWDSQAAALVYTNTATGLITNLVISPNGNRIVYSTSNGLYAVDRAANTNWQIAPPLSVLHAGPQFSGDSRFMVYSTPDAQVALDTNGVADVYLYDFVARSNFLVSQGNPTGAASGPSDSPAISSDGRFVAYRSTATNILPGATNGLPNVFLYDRQTGTTTLLSANASGMAGNNRSFAPQFSGDGQTVVFQSWASDLIPQDFNQVNDLVAVRIAPFIPTPPTITFQPVNQTVPAENRVTFSVGATGTAPLSYQWNFNGTNINGATYATLTLTNVQLSQAGNYAVLVTNAYGSILSSNAVLTVLGIPPGIIMQPTNQTVLVGGTTSFSVTAGGTPPLSYQWNFNGTNINGATDATLTITNAQLSQAGNYAVLVTNAFGSILSSNTPLTVLAVLPTIITQPAKQTVLLGSTARFSVIAGGSLPLYYQWAFNGTNIVGATNTILTLTNVQFSQAGSYAVLVTNAFGSVLSSNAMLMVNSCAQACFGLVSWWPGDGNANDIVGTNSGTMENGAGFAAGEVGQAFVFDGSSAYIYVPASSNLNIGLNNGFTLEMWINPANTDAGTITLMEWNDNSGNFNGIGVHLELLSGGRLLGDVADPTGGDHFLVSNFGVVVPGTFQHVAMTYDKTTGILVLYRNGVVVASGNVGIWTPSTSFDLYLGIRPAGVAAPIAFEGSMDEVSIYNRELTGDEIQAIYNAGSDGKCTPLAPVILAQPVNQTVFVGSMAILSVTAAGSLPLNYQWSFNGTNISGATNISLTLTNVQFNRAGNYAVLVTNAFGSILSSNAMLWVQDTYTYTTNNGTITITGYIGSGGDVTIPGTINGLPVTSIGALAFLSCASLTRATIPDSVISIGDNAFFWCTSLSNVTIGNRVISIGNYAFAYCYSLTSVTIPDSIISIGDEAFFGCFSLTGVYFQGNAPSIGSAVFDWDPATVYYLPGTKGWGTTFGGCPTAPWHLPNPLILNSPSFGVQTNQFGFIISWATNISVVVEACTNFASPVWQPVQTNTLTDGWCYFSDPDWTNYPVRFYRLRSP